MAPGGGGGGKPRGPSSRYPKGSPLEYKEEADAFAFLSATAVSGGEGEVFTVEVESVREPLDPLLEVEERLLTSDSCETSREVGMINGLGSTRRRTLGDGRSGDSGASGGPRRKVATAREAESYVRNSASSALLRFPLLAAAGSSTGAPALLFPLLPAVGTSRRLVKPPPSCGGSISISTSLLKSMIMSPPIAHPAVPYPPALIDGDKECFVQNFMILKER